MAIDTERSDKQKAEQERRQKAADAANKKPAKSETGDTAPAKAAAHTSGTKKKN